MTLAPFDAANQNAVDRSLSRRSIRCPRCGYDQRGVIAAWKEFCPIDGTCAECGLTFLWRDVLNPIDPVANWSVEQARSWIALPWRAIRTLMMMAMPWRFWAQIQMHHPIRVAPIAAMYALIAVFIVAISISTEQPIMQPYKGWFRRIEFAILTGKINFDLPRLTIVIAIVAAIMPLGFLAIPMSRHKQACNGDTSGELLRTRLPPLRWWCC